MVLEAWSQSLVVGQPLPVLPLWLSEELAVPLHAVASSRSRSTSRTGGSPKWRLYSRLKWEGSS